MTYLAEKSMIQIFLRFLSIFFPKNIFDFALAAGRIGPPSVNRVNIFAFNCFLGYKFSTVYFILNKTDGACPAMLITSNQFSASCAVLNLNTLPPWAGEIPRCKLYLEHRPPALGLPDISFLALAACLTNKYKH